jgi:transposase
VDDFALLKGRKYGTIIVDLQRHQPIELLKDRSAETLCALLQQYPEFNIIGRDRSTEYERAIEQGAPRAIEVHDDRWHLLKNLRQSTERILEGNHGTLSTVMLPIRTGPGEKDALVEHTPAAPRSSKEMAASVAYRDRRRSRNEPGSPTALRLR